jgi:lactoylglutathione lyase
MPKAAMIIGTGPLDRMERGKMKIDHVALWASDLERAVRFYVESFVAKPGGKYANPHKAFESCFLSFGSGPRLEVMRRPGQAEGVPDGSRAGLSHIAFSLGSVAEVDGLTERLRGRGFTVADGPRWTGDGYYESVVLDPDGNRVELTV